MELEALLAQIRSSFAYLFDEYGFQLVYLDPKLERPDTALIGLSSAYGRIVFDWEWGTLTPLIGAASAPFGQDVKLDGVEQWHNLERIIDYIQQRPFRWPAVNETPPPPTLLTDWANALQPIAPQVFHLFASQETMRHWQADFAAYAVAQVKRRFPAAS